MHVNNFSITREQTYNNTTGIAIVYGTHVSVCTYFKYPIKSSMQSQSFPYTKTYLYVFVQGNVGSLILV